MERATFLHCSRRLAGLVGYMPLIAACVAQPVPAERDASACGTLPAPFSPPVVCPIPNRQEMHPLDISQHENPCFDFVFEPDAQGGLRIPRQIACPIFKSYEGVAEVQKEMLDAE